MKKTKKKNNLIKFIMFSLLLIPIVGVTFKLNESSPGSKPIINVPAKNENIAGVEYNGEFDKSEYEIGRENDVEQEYPDEENLDDIPEELVEVIEGSETEEIILDDASDDEELVEEEFEEEIIEDSDNKL